MNIHKTTIHGSCPINGLWDYYELKIETSEFIACEDLDSFTNDVRGSELTQEDIANCLRDYLKSKLKTFTLSLTGTHGQNQHLTVRLTE